MRARRAVAVVAAGVASLGLAACGNVAERVAEEATERAIEADTGGDVDVNLDEDGSFSMKSEDGSMVMSADGELADGFPSEVPLVDGTVQASWSTTSPEGESWWVTLEVGDAEAAYADARSGLEGAGFTITNTYEGTSDGMFGGNLAAEGAWLVNVMVAEGEPSTVSYVLTTPAG